MKGMSVKFFSLAAVVVMFFVAGMSATFAQDTKADGTLVVLNEESAAQAADQLSEGAKTPATGDPMVQIAKYLAIAVSIFGGCLSAALAVGKVGAAAMGAAAEKPEVLGKAIAFVGLGEGIALFGFLVCIFLIFG